MIALPSASVIILQGAERTRSEINAAKLIELMGGEVAFVRLPEGEAAEAAHFRQMLPRGAAIIARAGALAAAAIPDGVTVARWLASVASDASQCFLFDFEANRPCDLLLEELTGGAFLAVETPTSRAGRLEVATGEGAICRQLSGLAFDADLHGSESVFVEGGNDASCSVLIRIGTKPLLLRSRFQNTALMLLASGEIVDPDESPNGRAPMAGLFSRLAPLLMFLRLIGGDRFWHNESPRACFILDDPLLKPRYGFLDFDRLLSLMREESFSTSIAFIPWNHRRSNRHVADLFRRFSAHLSMSIHGCDHTGAEFASTDTAFLRGQAARGLSWMTKHREATGVGFDDVMVFPQGHFSTVAMKALQSCGYLAAVNSTGHPVDGEEGSLRVRDLLDVAVTRFSGFPLFVRHYPDDVVGLALDLFLGKPALLVEHHGYFKDGYESLSTIVRMLRRMEPRLEWTNLSTICSRASLTRRLESGEVLVRFYTDRFELHNDTNESRCYLLQYQQGESSVSIKVDDARVDRTLVGDRAVARVEVGAGRAANVEVCREREPAATVLPRRALVWRAKVSVRRHLSEFRDNYVDKHPFLKRMASRVRR